METIKSRSRSQKYWDANRSELNAKRRARYLLEKDEIAAKNKELLELNGEEIRRKDREYYHLNKERLRKYQNEWVERNKEKLRENREIRRALTPTNRRKHERRLVIEQLGQCAICKTSIIEKCHLDHITPLVLGGTHDKNNLQLLCPTCNLRKGRKHQDTYLSQSLPVFLR